MYARHCCVSLLRTHTIGSHACVVQSQTTGEFRRTFCRGPVARRPVSTDTERRRKEKGEEKRKKRPLWWRQMTMKRGLVPCWRCRPTGPHSDPQRKHCYTQQLPPNAPCSLRLPQCCIAIKALSFAFFIPPAFLLVPRRARAPLNR